MRVALVQQAAAPDKAANLARGLQAFEAATRGGAALVAFAELAFERFYPQHPAGPEALSRAEPIPGPVTEAFRRRRGSSASWRC